ncbi:hypothetical protein B0H15DRAFT_993192 [Mycena belliarum]|uniref:Uncharacterized protein n=1 Tax=Mycena belliarum TaxID=1033014 RepID=A0AAD6XJG2_9AGAR|nr:hypothetical protein B0H15DRAFT_993192 [Mycena belliae]
MPRGCSVAISCSARSISRGLHSGLCVVRHASILCGCQGFERRCRDVGDLRPRRLPRRNAAAAFGQRIPTVQTRRINAEALPTLYILHQPKVVGSNWVLGFYFFFWHTLWFITAIRLQLITSVGLSNQLEEYFMLMENHPLTPISDLSKLPESLSALSITHVGLGGLQERSKREGPHPSADHGSTVCMQHATFLALALLAIAYQSGDSAGNARKYGGRALALHPSAKRSASPCRSEFVGFGLHVPPWCLLPQTQWFFGAFVPMHSVPTRFQAKDETAECVYAGASHGLGSG